MIDIGLQRTRGKDAALAMLATHAAPQGKFFATAARALVTALGYRWAGVALLEAGGTQVHVVALVEHARECASFTFAPRGTPCGSLYGGAPGNGYAYYCAALPVSFPQFEVFGKGVAQSYLGTCFRDDGGEAIGHVFVVDDKPRPDDGDARAFLALVGQRVGSEWIRQQSETRLRAIFDVCRDGILLITAGGDVLDANPAALDLLRMEKPLLLHHGLPSDVRGALLQAYDGDDPRRAEGSFRLQSRDGTPRRIEFTRTELFLNSQPCQQYFLRDITQRAAQEDLRRHYEAIMQHSQDFLSLVDRDYRYLAVSRKYGENFGSQAEIVGRTALEIHGENVFNNVIKPRFDRCLQGEHILWQHPIDGKDGSRMVEAHLIPCADQDGKVVGVVVNARDITESFNLSRRLAHQASHDELTQLPNRRDFEVRLTDALRGAQRGDSVHALCYLDLDQFKLVNDTVGHAAGDELLKQVASLLHSRLRGTDTLARLGGDEFGILLNDCPLEQARRILDDLLALLDGYRFRWANHTFQTTASIGLVPINAAAQSVQQLLSSADIACYVAKDMGRNRMHVYEMQDADLLRRQSELRFAGQLRAAVQEGRFELFHQPVARVQDPGGTTAYEEILVRMVGEQGELIQPGAFVGAAERYGLMRHVDEWVIRTVLRDYDALFRPLGSPRVAINLSGTSLADDSFLSFVRREIDATRFDPAKLCFEITETAAINNLTRVREFISDMRRTGCRFALDDFGSGLASFSYLKQFPVDYIKIDGVFVRAMEMDRLDRALVDAIGSVARAMGIGAIAEHLENEGTLAALRESGIEYAQGFFIKAPQRLTLRQ